MSVKCGIAECGMRKVKCGTDRAEKYRGMVCNLRNAENHYHSQRVSLNHDGTDGTDGSDGTGIQSVLPVPSASVSLLSVIAAVIN